MSEPAVDSPVTAPPAPAPRIPPGSPTAPKHALDAISRRLGIGVILCDDHDGVEWTNEWIEDRMPDPPRAGETFESFYSSNRLRATSSGSTDGGSDSSLGELVRVERDGEDVFYRHLSFELEGDDDRSLCAHCFVDETREKQLESTFLDNLQQLTSTKEIIDTLYESVSTEEVIYLILVAVTSQMGFGFNRAFYLEASGARLRGRIGIGASTIEDAHRIWARLAELNLPNLRAVYDDFTESGGPPDPLTQEIAHRMDFPLEGDSGGLLGAIGDREPAVMGEPATRTDLDHELCDLLGTDLVAMVPLFARDELAGVLIADNFITNEPISEKALSLLKTFSGYAGVALERSGLYDNLRRSVDELREANDCLKRNQRRLLQAEKLSAIGQLAACVSHEIRNPLVAIGALARSLLRDAELTETHQEDVSIIVDEVSRLEKFLTETLDFVKPEGVETISVDVRDEVERCVNAFHAEIEDQSIQLELDLDPGEHRSLVDPDLLHRAISNLVKNAIEALGDGGRIRVSLRRQGISVVIRVADTGPGIPDELHGRVFEPFFSTKTQGTGLGLAIASQSIRGLGGQISLQETSEFRTIFTITLPLEEPGGRNERGEELAIKERSAP